MSVETSLDTQYCLDSFRLKGLRPIVVGCIIKDNKILFTYKEKYRIWGLPQGGVEPNEDLISALNREMDEELGNSFIKDSSTKSSSIIFEDHVYFKSSLHGSRKLVSSHGEDIVMVGKKYFFVNMDFIGKDILISETEFDDLIWVNYEESLDILKTIYQRGKKRITRNILDILFDRKYIT